MRIQTLRTIAISMCLLLFDLSFWDFGFIPAYFGLLSTFVCSVLLVEMTPRFTRCAAISAAIAFVRTILLTGLASAEWLVILSWLVYHALLVLLVLSLFDAISVICRNLEHMESVGWCDRTGYIYSLHFVLYAGVRLFPDLGGVFLLADILITIFCIIIFFALYLNVHTQVEAVETQETVVDIDEYEAALQDAVEQTRSETEE